MTLPFDLILPQPPRHFPDLRKTTLSRISPKSIFQAWETAVAAGLPSEEVKKILSILAQDKARLRGTTDLIRDTKRSVQSSVAKIKAALLF